MKEITYDDYKSIAADRRRRILAMHENGVPVVELAALYRVSIARIYKIIQTEKARVEGAANEQIISNS